MRRSRRVLLAAVSIVGGLPGTATAHEIAGRFEAPLPPALVFGGAALTVAATALVFAFTARQPPERVRTVPVTVPPAAAVGLRALSRGLFFAAFVCAIVVGLAGEQVPAENFATVFVWAVWLNGIAIFSALVGSPWPVISPWKTLYDGLVRLEGAPIAVLGEYPDRLGAWPALGGFLLWFGLLAHFTAIPRSPRATAVLVAGYALVMLAGGVAFGPSWFRRADALAVLYRLFGRVAPIRTGAAADGGYRIRVRRPWRGCLRPVAGVAAAAFVVATVYTVSFDGFVSTPEYQTLRFAVRVALGTGESTGAALYGAGFVGFVAVFVAAGRLADRIAGTPSGTRIAAVLAFAPTILPIAVAYEIAHNYPAVVASAGRSVATLGAFLGVDPVRAVDPLAGLSLGVYWWSQVVLIVAGHLVAVIAAHYVTVARYPSTRAARRGHWPITLLMVGYTVLSLWIVSRPIVT